MRLGVAGDTYVELNVTRYQFPDRRGDGTGDDWDSNWLVVKGLVSSPGARAWSFEDPCLTTREALALHSWLRDVADGSVAPVSTDPSATNAQLSFTEPNLAFSLARRKRSDVVIAIFLSHESAPPSSPDSLGGFFVPVRCSALDVRNAVRDWGQTVVRFPVR